MANMGRKEKKKLRALILILFSVFLLLGFGDPRTNLPQHNLSQSRKVQNSFGFGQESFLLPNKCLATVEGTKKAKETSQPGAPPPPPSTPFPREKS